MDKDVERKNIALCMEGFPRQQEGSNGSYVKVIQRFLSGQNSVWASMISKSGGFDGIFGGATTECVIYYQQSRGITADGIVGPTTWGKIGRDLFPLESIEQSTQFRYYKSRNYDVFGVTYTANQYEVTPRSVWKTWGNISTTYSNGISFHYGY